MKNYDLTPVPQAATVEIGTQCVRHCEGCAFSQTPLERLTPEELQRSISVLSGYWDSLADDPEHQLIGQRIVEFIGGAGVMNRLSREDLQAVLDVAKANNLHGITFLCDAQYDERAIRDFFEVSTGINSVVALSADALPVDDGGTDFQREHKSNAAWRMLARRDEYIKDPETQNFRFFTTISKRNLSEIPEIARRVLESGSLLFVAPLTIHSEEKLAQTGVCGRLLMGTDISLLLDENDRDEMERVVTELKVLKSRFPATFLNADATFDNMTDCCKPLMDDFRNNCRERCAFATRDGEKLVATPNFRVVKRAGRDDMTLGICTCMVGPTDDDGNYANTALSFLSDIVEGRATTVDLYRRLTADLARVKCPGCNCRTSIDIKRGQGLV